MATSSTYSITVTAGNIVDAILHELTVIPIDKSAPGNLSSFIIQKINFWLLQQNGQHNSIRRDVMMWTRESGTLTLTTTDNQYDLKPSGGDLAIQIPDEIIKVVYRDSDDNDTPLEYMTPNEYQEISDKDSSGRPQRYTYIKKRDVGELYLDYVPDTADELIITYKQPLELITNISVEFDVDPAWYRAIVKSVAKDAAPALGKGLDDPIYQAIAMDANEAMAFLNAQYPNNETISMRPAR